MKKRVLILAMMFITAFSSFSLAQNPQDVDFTVLEDESMDGNFYPSLALWNSNTEDPSDLFYSFYLNVPKAGSVVRIIMEETKLNEETILQVVADEAGELEICPIIKWNYDVLASLTQGGTATMTCILEIDGKEIDRINNVIKYRSINECVYGVIMDDEWVDLSVLFSLYVNEDYPAIDKILQEILAVDRDRAFVDYQGDGMDFLNQVYWVWEYFSNKGTRYSNVVNTSNVSEKVGLQYVRFIDQVINNVQANCVDGSVLFSSIYRKIGLDVYLVVLPNHCMMAIEYPGYLEYEGLGSTGSDDGGMLLIETTLMGANTDPESSFMEAVTIMSYDEFNEGIMNEDYVVVNIEEARLGGFMPIQRPY